MLCLHIVGGYRNYSSASFYSINNFSTSVFFFSRALSLDCGFKRFCISHLEKQNNHNSRLSLFIWPKITTMMTTTHSKRFNEKQQKPTKYMQTRSTMPQHHKYRRLMAILRFFLFNPSRSQQFIYSGER